MVGRRFAVLSLLGLAFLGVPDGMIGVAWPSMAGGLGQPLGALGIVNAGLVAGATLGYLAGGRVTGRWGPGAVLAAAVAVIGVSGALYAAAPLFALIVVAAAVNGLGGGALDAGVNRQVALSGRVRLMQFSHAGYGFGTAVGPLVVVGALAVSGWRAAYVALAVGLVLACLLFWRWRASFQERPPAAASAPHPARTPLYWLTGAMFFWCFGTEISTGQWAYSVLRAHGLSSAPAGYLVAGYWAALTAGRVLAGLAAGRRSADAISWMGIGVAVAGAALFVGGRLDAAGPGLLLMGLGLGPLFPALVSSTPRRLHTGDTAFGVLFAMGSAGSVCVSAVAGVLTQLAGVQWVASLFLAGALALAACHAALTRLGPAAPALGSAA